MADESRQMLSPEEEKNLIIELEHLISNHQPSFSHLVISAVQEHQRDWRYPAGFGIGALWNSRLGMSELKVGYLKAFLNRTNLDLVSCVRVIQVHCSANEARQFYSSLGNRKLDQLGNQDLVKILLLDSCFVIEVIWRYNSRSRKSSVGDSEADQDYLSHPSIILEARRDMIVLENQLPFDALEGLFNRGINNADDDDHSFINLCINYLSEYMLIADSSQARESLRMHQTRSAGIKHLLDLLRICHAPCTPRQPPQDFTKLMKAMRRATQLDEAGMAIKPCESRSVCSIQYDSRRGTLEIPRIRVSNKSEFLLRHLINLEMRDHPYESYIIDYLHFMDALIDTDKDVDVLIHNRVIENFISHNRAVAGLFGNITKEARLFTPNYYYYEIAHQLNEYCEVPSHRWRATFKRDYCSSPWMIASTIAAIILLLLTFIQTICSIISIS